MSRTNTPNSSNSTIFSLLRHPALAFDSFHIPSHCKYLFQHITDIRGFFITTRFEADDLNLEQLPGIAIYYKSDWKVLQEFVECIFEYARFPFLEKFNIDTEVLQANPPGTASLAVNINDPYTETGRVISSGTGPADVFVFRASPAKLLPLAKVFRRDELPDIVSTNTHRDYQRPINSSKLNSIRSIISEEPTFMFPNSIMCVLSPDVEYSEESKTLLLPGKYGTLTVIDGQHRLFSYAGPQSGTIGNVGDSKPVVSEAVRQQAQILVMGIRFQNAHDDQITKFAAKTFVEINRNHTRIAQQHLYLIDHDVLGSTTGTALAAKVILKCNDSPGVARGLFKTNKRSTGILPVVTIIEELAKIVDIDGRIRNCENDGEVQGFENLFGRSINELTAATNLIEASTGAMKRYFNYLAQTFSNDWPLSSNCTSSFRRAKFFSAWLRLFDTMIKSGRDWNGVSSDLQMVRQNVLKIRDWDTYDDTLFVEDIPDTIPNWRHSVTRMHEFLNQNRCAAKEPDEIA